MTRRLLPLTLLVAALAAPAAASAADPLPLREKGDHSPLGDERLSDELAITRWAHTNLVGSIRSEPSHDGRKVGRLRWDTEDRLPEVYVVLQSRLDDHERIWLQIRMPGRPNGRTGWVREEQLSNLKLVETHLTIDRGSFTATLRKRGKTIWSSRIGV